VFLGGAARRGGVFFFPQARERLRPWRVALHPARTTTRARAPPTHYHVSSCLVFLLDLLANKQNQNTANDQNKCNACKRCFIFSFFLVAFFSGCRGGK
jgi:hypothetical protein